MIGRRQLVQLAGLGLAGLPGGARSAEAPLAPLRRFPRMMQEHLVARVRTIEAASLAALSALRTRADAEAYVARVKAKIRALFGPAPPRTSLAPRVRGRLARDGYVVEKVVFESRPGFPVTANLYLPRTREKRPAVVGSCGHADAGKAGESYQSFAQGLARLGFVVLIYDPLGQGERLQYPGGGGRSRVGIGVREHLLAGNQQFLVGEFVGAWRAWDGIRALDYLLGRPEVDPRHLGITGNSGGGTLATWLGALDDRWTMAAPACFVTTFRRNAENELPADTEQCPPGALAAGLDHADFIAAMAPKPVILLGKEGDFFDARGTEEAFARLRHLYELLGAPDRIQLHVSPGYHGFSQENREAMYRWFRRWTGGGEVAGEPPLTLEPPEALWCAPGGQVEALGARSVFHFTRETAQALARRRPPLEGPALADAIREVLRLPPRSAPPEYRILRPLRGRRHPRPHTAVYAVETEPGVQAVLYRLSDGPLLSRPPRGPRRAILYVAHRSSDAELRDEPLVRALLDAEPEAAFYALDVRGLGESEPDTCGQGSFLDPYGSDYFYAIHGIMLDRPYVGQRTHDVLAALDLLAAVGHEEVHLAGRGWGALPATFGALLHPAVTDVTLKNALVSYTAVATTELYRWPLAALAPGVLRRFDLPQCYAALAARRLRQIEPWDAGADTARL